MSNAETIEPGAKLKELASGMAGAFVLMQGYPATGFGRLMTQGLALSPALQAVQTGPFEAPWPLYSDIRVFQRDREYHAWRLAGGEWRGRDLRLADAKHSMKRQYPLWGTRTTEKLDGWSLRTEDRGTSVWIPEEFDRPGCAPALDIWQILEQNPATHLYGVTDAMITGFAAVEVRK